MEHPSVHLLSLVNDILIEICKTKTTANQNKGKYHQEPIRIQSEKLPEARENRRVNKTRLV